MKLKLKPNKIYQLQFVNVSGRRVEELVAEYKGGIEWRSKYGSKRYIRTQDILEAEEVETLE